MSPEPTDSRITISSWFETGIAYIDPDDHGPIGFAFASFLLLLYDKVVMHSPYAGQINSAEKALPADLQPLVLEWRELRTLACEAGGEASPPLVITAFPTYVDPVLDKMRDQEFRAMKGVDDERLDSQSTLYKSLQLIQEDPRPANAKRAIELAEDPSQLEKAELRIRGGELPPRFVQALRGEDFYCPKDLAHWWLGAMPAQKLIALAAYDHLNDRTALSKGGADTHCLTSAGEFAADLLFGIANPPFRAADMGARTFQSQLVFEVMQILSREINLRRLNANFIQEFRLGHKADFIRDITGILEETGQEPDLLARRRLARDRANKIAKLDKFPLLLGGLAGLLPKVLLHHTLGISQGVPGVGAYISERLPEADPTRRSRWRYALRTRGSSPKRDV
jgi:hypothetical protein